MQKQQKIDLEQTYTVLIKPVTDVTQKKSLKEALDRIEAMNQQLDYFHKTILVGYQEATTLLATLQKEGILRKEPGKEQTDESVITYLELLSAIKSEIERERIILETMNTTEEEKTIEVGEPAPEEFNTFLSQKIKTTKIQTKKIESSLRVSFSRYHHWINQTINRLHAIYNSHAGPTAHPHGE